MTLAPYPSGGLPIRPGMDVYSSYQDQYIGSVIAVWGHRQGEGGTPGSRGQAAGLTSPELVHEEGATVDPTMHLGRSQSGEEMGPFPTMRAGNSGPVLQSARRRFATEPNASRAGTVLFAVRPGRLNLGPLTSPLYVPTSAVRSVSMERVVIDVQRDQIPPAWRTRPS